MITEPSVVDAQTSDLDAQAREELVSLYRRLHVALNEPERSELLIELMSDARTELIVLGFELASRDLSAGATLGAGVPDKAVELIGHGDPRIRDQSVRLITRLAIPDAMQILSRALEEEGDPDVARSLLGGLRRWPTSTAAKNISRWFRVNSVAREAASGAAWALEDIDGWLEQSDRVMIAERLREIDDDALVASDFNLIATMGTREDLDRLVTLLNADDAPRDEIAPALVRTPFGVDPLIRAAEGDPAVSVHASEALARHRVDPDGLATLARLPFPDPEARAGALRRMVSRLSERDRATGVVTLLERGSVDTPLARELLRPLLSAEEIRDPQIASGLLVLGTLELNASRADRALEALSAAIPSLADDDLERAVSMRRVSLILTGAFEDPLLEDSDPSDWIGALNRASGDAQRVSIALEARGRPLVWTDEQEAMLEAISGAQAEPAPDPAEGADGG